MKFRFHIIGRKPKKLYVGMDRNVGRRKGREKTGHVGKSPLISSDSLVYGPLLQAPQLIALVSLITVPSGGAFHLSLMGNVRKIVAGVSSTIEL